MGYDWGMWAFGWLFMALFWIFVIAGVVWLVLTVSGQRDRAARGPDRTALQILEERLARGAIDVEEFQARKAALEEGAR